MIKEFILKQTLFKNRLILLEDKKNIYKSITDKEDIYNYQLNKFNKMWQNAYKNIPFYKMWKEKYNLPNKIDNLDELIKFPILTKKDIQENFNLIFEHLKDFTVVSTGGSTGEPTKFPTSKSEMEEIYASTYVARDWWSVEPLDDMLMFWGHSHLFGSGIKGQLNQYKRMFADWLINIKRLNAYDMSIDTLKKYYEQVRVSNPKSILGYTSSIYKLAKYIDDNNLDIGNKSNLKGIIVTSETVTQSDVNLIEKVFKVPCISEYGMAETGVISYSKDKSNNIIILWDMFISTKSENNLLNVTTLYDKKFPLINYNTDDKINILEEYKGSILKLNSIDGRIQDSLNIKTLDNKILNLSGILMVHILKGYPNIYEVTFQQLNDSSIVINIVSNIQLNIEDVKKYFINTIKKDHNNIDGKAIVIQQIEKSKKTIAGKIQMISKEII